MKRIRRDIVAAVLLFLFLVLHSPPSLALQPVETFLAGAREGNPDELEVRATALEQQGQALSSLGRVLPGVAANGSYTRNQYSSAITLAEPGQPAQTVTLLPRVFFSSRRRHTRFDCDWSSDVCSSDLGPRSMRWSWTTRIRRRSSAATAMRSSRAARIPTSCSWRTSGSGWSARR